MAIGVGGNTISVQTIIEKNQISSNVPFLFFLEVDVINRTTGQLIETMKIVRNSEPVTYRNQLYAAANFELEFKSAEGEQASVNIRIKDYNRSIQAVAQRYEGGVGSIVRLMVVNGSMLDSPPDIEEVFQIVQATARNFEMNWTLGAMDLLSARVPKRKQMRDRCCWKFKSSQCGYVGTSNFCDLSLQGPNGCSAHYNQQNFGGFPGIVVQ